jgi:hypothetical protein
MLMIALSTYRFVTLSVLAAGLFLNTQAETTTNSASSQNPQNSLELAYKKICHTYKDLVAAYSEYISLREPQQQTYLQRATLLISQGFSQGLAKLDKELFPTQQLDEQKKLAFNKLLKTIANAVDKKRLKVRWPVEHRHWNGVLDHVIPDYPLFDASLESKLKAFVSIIAPDNINYLEDLLTKILDTNNCKEEDAASLCNKIRELSDKITEIVELAEQYLATVKC